MKRSRPVHPHTRGEHVGGAVESEYPAGSSPHTWGTRLLLEPLLVGERFIPTHVGNTMTQPRRAYPPPVHPHTRGEHATTIDDFIYEDGSSPHTWGTPRKQSRGGRYNRFIPTHVGNTVVALHKCFDCSVHPHTRGEHVLAMPGTMINNGSSPHTWGTLYIPCAYCGKERFIPTHVGNTTDSRESKAGVSVHPHTRGEHLPSTQDIPAQLGSSPHTWGTRLL